MISLCAVAVFFVVAIPLVISGDAWPLYWAAVGGVLGRGWAIAERSERYRRPLRLNLVGLVVAMAGGNPVIVYACGTMAIATGAVTWIGQRYDE